MKLKAEIMNEKALYSSLTRISYEIVEKEEDLDSICLVGIHTRGVPMAYILQEKIEQNTGKILPVGVLDISLYRDDLSLVDEMPRLNSTNIPFNITNKNVILVDDVLYTGRTARAAIDALFSLGRPKSIRLAILVDRGHRELPIRPDFIGKNLPTSQREVVAVRFPETDGEASVQLFEKEE